MLLAANTSLTNRYALVTGNSTCQHGNSLNNHPLNDARGMAERLESLGFQVSVVTDATKSRLEQAIGQFSKRAQAAGVALFFYAGHGVEAEGVNYLIPTDARLDEPADARLQALSLDLTSERDETLPNQGEPGPPGCLSKWTTSVAACSGQAGGSA